MPVVVIYTSIQACPSVLDVALDLRAKGHDLRPLSTLPRPRPARLASLQLELASLLQDERTMRWVLSQYVEGRRPPDADRESGLRDDLGMTLWRIDNVMARLQSLATQLVLA